METVVLSWCGDCGAELVWRLWCSAGVKTVVL